MPTWRRADRSPNWQRSALVTRATGTRTRWPARTEPQRAKPARTSSRSPPPSTRSTGAAGVLRGAAHRRLGSGVRGRDHPRGRPGDGHRPVAPRRHRRGQPGASGRPANRSTAAASTSWSSRTAASRTTPSTTGRPPDRSGCSPGRTRCPTARSWPGSAGSPSRGRSRLTAPYRHTVPGAVCPAYVLRFNNTPLLWGHVFDAQ
jgi:hypothetical protein